MTKETILKKVIEKAVKNGWQHNLAKRDDGELFSWLFETHDVFEHIIFSHKFAKVFFGEIPITVKVDKPTIFIFKNWQYHLQQMVLEKDPVKYLEKFLLKVKE